MIMFLWSLNNGCFFTRFAIRVFNFGADLADLAFAFMQPWLADIRFPWFGAITMRLAKEMEGGVGGIAIADRRELIDAGDRAVRYGGDKICLNRIEIREP